MIRDLIPHSRPWIIDEDRKSVDDVLISNMVAQGSLVEKFEKGIAKKVGMYGAVATSCGTAALILALRLLDIDKNSQVIVPTYVCRNVLEAIITVGAEPVFCDSELNWIVSPKKVEPLINKHTSAIIAVHTFGIPVDIKGFMSLGIPIIEDACQAFGLLVEGVPAGALGTMGFYSFHATKCLTTGEGGMLVVNSPDLYQKAIILRDGCSVPGYRLTIPMSDLQAALGLSQLRRYDQFLLKRKLILDRYINTLKQYTLTESPHLLNDFLFRFTLRIQANFNRIQDKLLKQDIVIKKGVDTLLHRLLGYNDRDFPNATKLINETVSFPFYPSLNEREQERVIAAIKDVSNEYYN